MNKLPLVSIILPIRNESGFIAQSLNAVLEQDYPMNLMEVIVVDGMSTDGTREIVRMFQAQHDNIQLIDNPGMIVPTGLNAAIAKAKGEIIVRVDGHCEIAPDYVRRCVEHLQNDGVDGVGGPIETVGETPLAEVIAIAMSSSFGVGGSAFRTVSNKTMLTDTVAFPAYTRKTLTSAGPFDEELVRNQDDEYNYRLRKLGATILLAADVRSRYYSRSTLRSLWRQYLQYGYWKVRVMQKHPRQMRPRQFAPPLFVATLAGTILLVPISSLSRKLLAAVISSYMIANLSAALWIARHAGWYHRLLLPIAFAVLHISYGLGFLKGLVRFWNRWPDSSADAKPLTDNTSETYVKHPE